MSIKVEKNGVTYTVDGSSEDELERELTVLHRALGLTNGTVSRLGRPRKKAAPSPKRKRFESKRKQTLQFLRFLNEDDLGQTTQEVADRMGLKHQKAVGSVTATVNALLKSAGIAKSKVYESVKRLEQPRVFSKRSEIESAIEKITHMEWTD